MASAPPPICYLSGTRIRTPGGDCRIDDLVIGDRVLTAKGETHSIKWIGRRRYTRTAAAWPKTFRPVLIRKDALGEDRPAADLYVSRKHCLLLDGVLVPAKYLVNGDTIVLAGCEDRLSLEYLHIELGHHDAILAEDVAAETFCSNGHNTEVFDNFAERARLYPGDTGQRTRPFANIVNRPTRKRRMMDAGRKIASAFGS